MGNGTRRGSFCLRQKLCEAAKALRGGEAARARAILAQPKSLRRAGARKHGITTAASTKVRTIARIEKAAVRDLQRYCRFQADPSRGASLRSPPIRRPPRLSPCRQFGENAKRRSAKRAARELLPAAKALRGGEAAPRSGDFGAAKIAAPRKCEKARRNGCGVSESENDCEDRESRGSGFTAILQISSGPLTGSLAPLAPHSASAAAFTMSAIWRKRKKPQCKALLPSTRGSQLCRSPPATYPVPYRYKTQTAVHSNCRTPPKIQPDIFYSASTSSFFLKKSEMHQSAESATRM